MSNENRPNLNQLDVFKKIDSKLNELYTEIISTKPKRIQVVTFNLLFVIQEGSVKGNVTFESVAKLTG